MTLLHEFVQNSGNAWRIRPKVESLPDAFALDQRLWNYVGVTTLDEVLRVTSSLDDLWPKRKGAGREGVFVSPDPNRTNFR